MSTIKPPTHERLATRFLQVLSQVMNDAVVREARNGLYKREQATDEDGHRGLLMAIGGCAALFVSTSAGCGVDADQALGWFMDGFNVKLEQATQQRIRFTKGGAA